MRRRNRTLPAPSRTTGLSRSRCQSGRPGGPASSLPPIADRTSGPPGGLFSLPNPAGFRDPSGLVSQSGRLRNDTARPPRPFGFPTSSRTVCRPRPKAAQRPSHLGRRPPSIWLLRDRGLSLDRSPSQNASSTFRPRSISRSGSRPANPTGQPDDQRAPGRTSDGRIRSARALADHRKL